MVHPAFEARIYFLRTGGVISSRDTRREAYLRGNEVHYRTVPAYKCEQHDSTSYYDFGSVVFKVIISQNAYRIVVDKDENNQEKRIWVDGLGVFEGKNLAGRFKQFPAHHKPTFKKPIFYKPFKYIVKPIVKNQTELEVQTVKLQTIENPALTIVIPIRNRHGTRIRNCLKSIELQTEKSIETIISDYGSTSTNHSKLIKTIEPFDCTLYYCKTKNVWNLSKARNIGIRKAAAHANPDKIIMSIDADLMLESRVVEAILRRHRKNPKTLITSKVFDLPKGTRLTNIELPKSYKKFGKIEDRKRWGFGALMSARGIWWRRVRGFDERISVWGAEDDDLRKRARLDGLKVVELQDMNLDNIKVFHQWHPKAMKIHKKHLGEDVFAKVYEVNLAILKLDETIRRNNKKWGAM